MSPPTTDRIVEVSDHTVELMAMAHCDYFGGEGWWDTGLIADTKPKAMEAMRAAIAATHPLSAELEKAQQRSEMLDDCNARQFAIITALRQRLTVVEAVLTNADHVLTAVYGEPSNTNSLENGAGRDAILQVRSALSAQEAV